MSEWLETSLGAIATWSGGMTPSKAKSAYWQDGTIPWVSSKEVTGGVLRATEHYVTEMALESTSLRLFPANSVAVVVRSGILQHTLPVALVPFECTVNQDVKVAIAGSQTTGPFLRYLLEANSRDILQKLRKTGTTVQSIDVPSLLAMRVRLPPATVQSRIVDLLTAVDWQGTCLRKERLLLVEAYTALLDLLFRESANSIPHPRRLEAVLRLDVHRVPLLPDSEFRLAGVLNAGKGLIDKGTLRGRDTDYAAMNRLAAGQVVMRKLTAWEGPIAVVPEQFDGFLASNEFPTFTMTEALDPTYFSHVCRSDRLRHEMRQRVTGSVQRRKRLNPDQLLAVSLPIPSLEAQGTVASALDTVLAGVAVLEAEESAVRAIRHSLLRDLLKGELEIPDSYDAVMDGAA